MPELKSPKFASQLEKLKNEIKQNNIQSFEDLKQNMLFKNLIWQVLGSEITGIARNKPIKNNITDAEDFVQQGALILFDKLLTRYTTEEKYSPKTETYRSYSLFEYISRVLKTELIKYSVRNSSRIVVPDDMNVKMNLVNNATSYLFDTLKRYPNHSELLNFLVNKYSFGEQSWNNFFKNYNTIRLAMPGQFLYDDEERRIDLITDNSSLLQDMENQQVSLEKVFEIVDQIAKEKAQNPKKYKEALPLDIQVDAFKTYLQKLIESKNQIAGQTEIAQKMSQKYQMEIKQYQISRNNEKWFELVKIKLAKK